MDSCPMPRVIRPHIDACQADLLITALQCAACACGEEFVALCLHRHELELAPFSLEAWDK